MAVYVLVGALGSGKTLLAVWRIQQALFAGARVATNIDLRLEKIVNGNASKKRLVTRLPDWPTMADFEALGFGDAEDGSTVGAYNERKFGCIVLDEAAVYFNSRSWNEKNSEHGGERRMKVISWLRHARKFGWDVLLITQDLSSLDKQIREGLCEHVVYCRRMDRLALPIVSVFTRILGLGSARLPQVHVGVVRYGTGPNAPLGDRWVLWFGQQFHGAYDTRQRILGENDGAATMLDARHAPYMWAPMGLYDVLWRAFLWRWFAPSKRQRAHDEFRLSGQGVQFYKPSGPTFAEWDQARRVTAPEGAPPLGGGEGEAAPIEVAA